MLKKTWLIIGEVTRDDLEWVMRSKLTFMLGEERFLDLRQHGSSSPVKFLNGLEPSTIITTSEKEETWLKLYFSDRVLLIAEEYIMVDYL